MENLINFRWQISLGGETLSREEFEALVTLKAPLVQIRGQWVQLDPDQIEAAIRFWEKVDRQGDTGLLDALQMGLDADDSRWTTCRRRRVRGLASGVDGALYATGAIGAAART